MKCSFDVMMIVALRLLSVILAAVATLIMTSAVNAHPHVLPTVKTNLIFGPAGLVTAIEQIWLYDVAYSTFVSRDIDADKNGTISNDELATFAKNQIDALAEHSYFTAIRTPAGVFELGAREFLRCRKARRRPFAAQIHGSAQDCGAG